MVGERLCELIGISDFRYPQDSYNGSEHILRLPADLPEIQITIIKRVVKEILACKM